MSCHSFEQKINNICLKYQSKRRKLNKSIVAYLNKKFKINPRPNKSAIKQLASHTFLSSNQVKSWFLSKTLKYNKFNKKTKKTYLIHKKVTYWFTYKQKLALQQLNLTKKQVNKWFKTRKQCTIYYSNYDKYKGQIKHGKRDGKGIYKWHDGTKYVGNWIDDKRNDDTQATLKKMK